jgi:hypothetical protein
VGPVTTSGGRLFYLDSTAYSYDGDYVCQNGYTMFWTEALDIYNAYGLHKAS